MPDFIDDIQIESLIQQLKLLHDELVVEVDSLNNEAKPVELDQQAFGRVSRGEALQHQSMAKANLAQCQERIRQIEEALLKIDNEAYGYCDACGESIPLPRLNARPESSLCLACQSKHEKDLSI